MVVVVVVVVVVFWCVDVGCVLLVVDFGGVVVVGVLG